MLHSFMVPIWPFISGLARGPPSFPIQLIFIEFKLEVQKGGIKNFELPYPFEIKETQSRLVFNYKLSKLVYEDIVLLTRIKRMKPKKKDTNKEPTGLENFMEKDNE